MTSQALSNQEMNTKKVEIISFITHLEKIELLLEIESLIKSSVPDWWNLMTKIEKEKIEDGLLDFEEGRISTHENVMLKSQAKIDSFNR